MPGATEIINIAWLRQQLGKGREARHRLDIPILHQGAEALGERDLGLGLQILAADEEHQVFGERLLDLDEGRIAGLAQIDALDIGAERA